jgi:hypothetical protein
MRGFDEVIIPLLIREMNLAHKRPWGRNAVFLLKGNKALKDRVLWQIKDFLHGPQDFIFSGEEGSQLPSEYAEAKQIVITTPGQTIEPGRRHFYMQSIKEGDIPNFRGSFRASLALGRVDKLETTNPRFLEIKDFIQLLLGYPIEDAGEFIQVLEGKLQDEERVKSYALPAITRLPINLILQAARLAIKMAEQAA